MKPPRQCSLPPSTEALSALAGGAALKASQLTFIQSLPDAAKSSARWFGKERVKPRNNQAVESDSLPLFRRDDPVARLSIVTWDGG